LCGGVRWGGVVGGVGCLVVVVGGGVVGGVVDLY
jgi:hypothetical protein